jgi:hypothetical protein
MIKTYERHSPSALNLFASSPAMFTLEKILGKKQPVGAPAHRGTAVEQGVTYGLEEGIDRLPQAIDAALTRFDSLAALSGDPRSDNYRRDIPAMVEQAMRVLAQYGIPSKTQGYVEWRPDELQLPIVGYFDYEWKDKGVIVDLKTTEKMPSEIRKSHAKQVSLYCASDNLDGVLVYVTPKKIAAYHLENISEHREVLKRIAIKVERFLSLSDDPQFFIDITVPDLEHYLWGTPEARALAWEIWGV